MSADPYAAMWRSPGGRLHRRRVCSFNPSPGHTKLVAVTRDEYVAQLDAGKVCICLRWNRPLFDMNREESNA